MKKTLLVILSVMGVAGWTSVQAQLIDVNFIDDSINTAWGGGAVPAPAAMSGAAVIGSATDVWNGLGGFAYSAYPLGATFTSGALVDSTGVITPVTLSLTASSGTYDANSIYWGNNSPFTTAGSPYAVLMASCLVSHTAGVTDTVTLSGLTPNGAYSLYTYNASDANEAPERTSTFTVNGLTLTSVYDGATTTLVNGVDYLQFAATADAGGNLVISFGNSANGDETDFNGFQLEAAVPEPGTLALLASGAVLLLGYRRKALRA